MLGISVYLGNDTIREIDRYIQKVSEMGFTSIFTSLHIPEDDPALYKERLQQLGALAKKSQMELMADISPKSLAHLGFNWDNAEGLLKWGVTGLRVDYGVDEKTIIKLSKKMKIALNASTLTKGGFEKLKQAGLSAQSVEAWHNFYPRPETGLGALEFNHMNQWLRSEGLTVMAFIPGDKKRRGPLFQGLPTLEDHRNMAPFASYIELLEMVDKILIGDVELSDETLEQFSSFQEDVFLLRAEAAIDDEALLKDVGVLQTNRPDSARDCVRSMESRQYALIGTRPVQPLNTSERLKGSITIDNERYGRYQGEVQIAKRDLPADEKVNVIGRVIEQDRPLLKYIDGGRKFKITWISSIER
ncbi:MupG family TIM beta-alpha barrel fold protein [Bacillus sp. FJAT-50079]|uniref:DUF871 domain-containing protein n=1 Tax=Bacillus sp. FJAT-50079 TaxID=2833577 RepID=UPI001BC9CE11|nr:MupG family TIM beta-alpha barrel fold protein [Bacillus sp. FJAT-50079]MBS4206899.1 DUF871 domain-containing protein [Bacillus sp. FJAT-50079]